MVGSYRAAFYCRLNTAGTADQQLSALAGIASGRDWTTVLFTVLWKRPGTPQVPGDLGHQITALARPRGRWSGLETGCPPDQLASRLGPEHTETAPPVPSGVGAANPPRMRAAPVSTRGQLKRDLIEKLRACGTEAVAKLPHLNHGGCGVYAANVAMALEERGLTVWGVITSCLRDDDLNRYATSRSPGRCASGMIPVS